MKPMVFPPMAPAVVRMAKGKRKREHEFFVLFVFSTSRKKNCTNNDEYNNNDNLDKGKPIFKFTINTNAHEIDTYNNDQENGGPCCIRHHWFPIINNCSSSSKFYK